MWRSGRPAGSERHVRRHQGQDDGEIGLSACPHQLEPQPHFPLLAAHRRRGCGGAHRSNAAPTPLCGLRNLRILFLLVASPVVAALLALRWFSDGHLQPQPVVRFARLGRWTKVDRPEAETHPLYGTSGIMVSLLVGIMLNVPVRVAEYLTSMPPIPVASPHWLSVLHLAMTFDVVAFSILYMTAFIAALRRVPLFPRLLLAIWLADLAMQLVTAQIASSAQLPQSVAAALHAVLVDNVKKVLIGMALWLPYLLLSTRVNVTYRHRVPA